MHICNTSSLNLFPPTCLLSSLGQRLLCLLGSPLFSHPPPNTPSLFHLFCWFLLILLIYAECPMAQSCSNSDNLIWSHGFNYHLGDVMITHKCTAPALPWIPGWYFDLDINRQEKFPNQACLTFLIPSPTNLDPLQSLPLSKWFIFLQNKFRTWPLWGTQCSFNMLLCSHSRAFVVGLSYSWNPLPK